MAQSPELKIPMTRVTDRPQLQLLRLLFLNKCQCLWRILQRNISQVNEPLTPNGSLPYEPVVKSSFFYWKKPFLLLKWPSLPCITPCNMICLNEPLTANGYLPYEPVVTLAEVESPIVNEVIATLSAKIKGSHISIIIKQIKTVVINSWVSSA